MRVAATAQESRNRGASARLSRTESGGFTIMELVVALAIIGLMAAIVAPFGREMLADYRYRGMVRSFVGAMHMARIQAVDNRALIEITTSQSADGGDSVRFTASDPHGLTTDTRVMMSGLDCHQGMNGNEFELSSDIDADKFKVEFKWDIVHPNCDSAKSDTMGYARNITAPSKLIIEGKPLGEASTGRQFAAKSFTVKKEGTAVKFEYTRDYYELTLDGNDAGTTPREIVFDSRGFTRDYLSHTLTLRRKDTPNPAKTEIRFSVSGNGRLSSTP
jgi:prepilin-type N-terminal cleavage/methylation domain-containing protein